MARYIRVHVMGHVRLELAGDSLYQCVNEEGRASRAEKRLVNMIKYIRQ